MFPRRSHLLYHNVKFSVVFWKEKRVVVIRSLPTDPFFSIVMARLIGIHWGREDEDEQDNKQARNALAIVPTEAEM